MMCSEVMGALASKHGPRRVAARQVVANRRDEGGVERGPVEDSDDLRCR